jgi:putative ABC transport system substrate-binding protein
MRRRAFLTLLGGGAAAWPLAARAQQSRLPLIGFLSVGSAGSETGLLAAFRQGLSEAGFAEGRNVAIEYRWAEGRYDRLPGLCADLIGRQAAVITAIGGPSARAALAATKTVPIVYAGAGDPVRGGLVESLNRPGNNLTGVTSLGDDLIPKRLELLREVVPDVSVVAALVNPASGTADLQSRDLEKAAQALGLKELQILKVSAESDFEPAFAAMSQARAGALVVAADAFLASRAATVTSLALRHALPAIFGSRAFVAAGGLLSYEASDASRFHQIGAYVARILNGAKPADLPIMQPTRFELIVNLKTAKALGLTVPDTLLVAADEVIE